jgi:hypothetical protein
MLLALLIAWMDLTSSFPDVYLYIRKAFNPVIFQEIGRPSFQIIKMSVTNVTSFIILFPEQLGLG